MNLITSQQQTVLLEKVLATYSAHKSRNAAFSMRAFSKKLGVSSGALSEILQKKRAVTVATARKMLGNLNTSPDELEMFFKADEKKNKVQRAYTDLSIDHYQILSSWEYLAILNFIELKDESHSVENMASRLGLSQKEVKSALDRLLRLEMIKRNENKFERTYIRFQTSDDISNGAIRKYHAETLERAGDALNEVAVELRDMSAMVLKLNPNKLKEVKKLIREFQDQVAELVEKDDANEIYQFNVYLYPLTKKTDGAKK